MWLEIALSCVQQVGGGDGGGGGGAGCGGGMQQAGIILTIKYLM